jgi:hypothetical protein
MKTTGVYFVVLGALLFRPLKAQEVTAPLPVGTRAWIYGSQVPDRGLKGTLLGQRQDSVLFQPDGKGARLVLPLRTIRRVLLSERRTSRLSTGLIVGGLLGGALGAVISLGGGDTSQDLPLGFALGAGAGLAVGAAVGSVLRTEHWRRRAEPLRVESIESQDQPPSGTARVGTPQ